MTEENERPKRVTGFLSPLLDTIIIATLLLSGIAIIFVGKMTGQIASRLLFLEIGLGVEIVAVILIAIYAYIRYFRRSI